MIVINDDTPRWIREFHRFVKIKSFILVHGNVLDLVSYNLKKPNGDGYWSESHIGDFLHRYLLAEHYDIIAELDPLDGLSFANAEMNKAFDSVVDNIKNTQQESPKKSLLERGRMPNQPSGKTEDIDAAIKNIALALANRSTPCAVVINFASRLISAPEHLSAAELSLFTRLLKASLQCAEVINERGRWHNILILVCDKINDIPAFVYLNNPRARSIAVDRPSRSDRKRFLLTNHTRFYQAQEAENKSQAPTPSEDLVNLFSVLTEGFCYYELLSLMGLSQREQIPLNKVQTLCEQYKYGVAESEWDKLDRNQLENAGTHIRQRIKGQNYAVERLLEIIKRAKLGIAAGSVQKSQRPRGVLFFAGPTGVGKTEMAKGLAELLFGKEERLIRFDMSEFSSAHADQKLLGSPPGYVGYEEGGKLTNAMKEQPYSVLLFDEIEKAHGSIFDKFLQMLDDGRMTDGKGETVYFSESIIIFTSNLGTVSLHEDGRRRQLIDPSMSYLALQDTVLAAIRDHFNFQLGRPEILNRFGENFVVFDFIRPPHDTEITQRLIEQLILTLSKQHNITLVISKEVEQRLHIAAKRYLSHGGRGIRNMFDAALVNPLASYLFDHNISAGSKVTARMLRYHEGQDAPRFELECDHE